LKLGELVDLCIGIQLGGEGDSKDFKEKYFSENFFTEESTIVMILYRVQKSFNKYQGNIKKL
jgi:hypothetical protein